jgi:hypothetical protein
MGNETKMTPADFVKAMGEPNNRMLCSYVCVSVLDNLPPDGVRQEMMQRFPHGAMSASPVSPADLMVAVPVAVTSSLGQKRPEFRTLRVFRARPPLARVEIRVDERVVIAFLAKATHVEITVDKHLASPLAN